MLYNANHAKGVTTFSFADALTVHSYFLPTVKIDYNGKRTVMFISNKKRHFCVSFRQFVAHWRRTVVLYEMIFLFACRRFFCNWNERFYVGTFVI